MKFNSKTITLTTDAINNGNKKENKVETELRAKAIAILLGEYNKYGRNINIEDYKKIKHDFENCIYRVKQLIK
jgi:hypothetical protein